MTIVTQSCLTLCGHIDCSPPGSSVHGIFQARILEWVAIFCSRGSSQIRTEPASLVFPALVGGFFTSAPPGKPTIERVTGRKARGLQTEEIACECQTFLSLLRGRRKQTSDIFFLLYTNLKGGFS